MAGVAVALAVAVRVAGAAVAVGVGLSNDVWVDTIGLVKRSDVNSVGADVGESVGTVALREGSPKTVNAMPATARRKMAPAARGHLL